MKLALPAIIAVLLLAPLSVAFAHDMEATQTEDSDDTGDKGAMGAMGGHKMLKSEHMTMTPAREATAADAERGREIIATMRDKLAKYQDYKLALADGYEPFMPTVPQDVYHFASRDRTAAEYAGSFDLASPGSLLYEKQALGGWKLVGAMYDGPPEATPEQLDKLIPLSLSHWHAHTNICLPAGMTEQDVIGGNVGSRMRPDIASVGTKSGFDRGLRERFGYLADARFGFSGTIDDEAECSAAGGNFHRQIFGWMIHVYSFASEDFKVAFSTEAP
jgi:hypothetical protein